MDEGLVIAKEVVKKYWRREHDELLPEHAVKTVWFAYILGGWKTMQMVDNGEGDYFEITYNREKDEIYLDRYTKAHNEKVELSADFRLNLLRERLTRG